MSNTTHTVGREALQTLATLTGPQQRRVMLDALRGEEGEHFARIIEGVHAAWEAMPKTYETDGQGAAAVAGFHFFTGECDWWIVERDSDEDGEGQVQAFGIADLGQGCRELGYINLVEALACGAELDLYWTGKAVGEIMKEG